MGYRNIRALRRASQVVLLLTFLVLLFKTGFRGSVRSAAADIHLPYTVRLFLEFDPLAAAANALATHALYRGLLWAVVLLVATLFLGRFFCGWICPLGTLNHFFSEVRSESKRGKRRIESNRYQRWQSLKYYLLIALLAAAVVGSGAIGWLDPISLTVRSAALSVLPAFQQAVDSATGVLYHSGNHPLRMTGEVVQFILGNTVFSFRQPHFRQAFIIALIFIVLLFMNLRLTRFWCRALCPLGALLGLLSRWGVVRLEKRTSDCGDCNRCVLHCQGGDNPDRGWRQAECTLCLNCVAECPDGALAFRWLRKPAGAIVKTDLTRRRALWSLGAGLAMVPLMRAATSLKPEDNDRLIRPPGALEENEFLARCIRCDACLKVCPNNALQPALGEAGVEGLWTPVLAPRVGYCEPSCVLCGEVCPTGAIWQITAREKGWVTGAKTDKPVHIGTAFYDHGRCLPWAMATDCIVCQEWCPTSPKAVYLRPAEVFDANGNAKQVRQPYIDPARCVGCGACEFACPVRDRPAVYVTSIGETRSKSNQVLLQSGVR